MENKVDVFGLALDTTKSMWKPWKDVGLWFDENCGANRNKVHEALSDAKETFEPLSDPNKVEKAGTDQKRSLKLKWKLVVLPMTIDQIDGHFENAILVNNKDILGSRIELANDEFYRKVNIIVKKLIKKVLFTN